MKRQGPRRGAATSVARGATRSATPAAAATRQPVATIEAIDRTIESPSTTPTAAALEPVCAQELRETGEAAIADYVRRIFFRLPCPAAEAAPQRAAGPREREKAWESVAVAEAGAVWTVPGAPPAATNNVALDGSAMDNADSAARTRSRASDTALSGRPTRVNPGWPVVTAHCTSTMRASTPSKATVKARAVIPADATPASAPGPCRGA